MADRALTLPAGGQVATPDFDAAFADFLRLRVADGDASPHTLRSYYGHMRAFVSWCDGQGVGHGQLTAGDLESYRRSAGA